jgi:predicted NAD-dependent protein-ADP-ribosyltransferase YbiA (DUF1768 family)
MEDHKKSIRDALQNIIPRKKAKYVSSFTAEGDILVTDKEGNKINTYVIPNYRAPTTDELYKMEEDRRTKVTLVENDIDQIYPRLRAASKKIMEIDDSAIGDKMIARSEYISINRELNEANAHYSEALYPNKRIQNLSSVPNKLINIERYNDDSIINHSINLLRQRPFELDHIFEREGEIEVAEIIQQDEQGEKFIQLTADHWLSPDNVINFIYEGQQYHSIRQALEAWKARTGGDYELESRIMKTTTPLESKALGIPNKDIPTDVIKSIISVSVDMNKPRKILLNNMLEDTYMYMDNDVILGIGTEGPINAIITRANWMGENRYGLAITDLIKQSKVEAKTAARTGAIIGRRIAMRRSKQPGM